MQGFAGLLSFATPSFELTPAEMVFRRYFADCTRSEVLLTFRMVDVRDCCGATTPPPIESRRTAGIVGTIHNEADLRREMQARVARDASLAEVFAALYERRGRAGFSALVGDFSAFIVDQKTRKVILVRDPIGTRPLFYSVTATSVAWSTEIEPLVEWTNASIRLDEEFVGAFLCNADLSDRTPYKGILKIPPGHAGEFQACGSSLNRYWDAADFESALQRSDEDYERQFFHLFSSAVKCRLPQEGIATAELSGGLDSTSIVRMADHLIESGVLPRVSLHTASMIFDRSLSANEEKYIAPVEAMRRSRTFRILESEHPLFRFSLQQRYALPNQKHPLQLIYKDLGRYLTEERSVSHLCGLGGDQVMWSRDLFYPPAHFAKSNRGMSLSAALKTWSRSEGLTYFQLFREGSIIPALPYGLRKRLDFGGMSSPAFLREGLAAHIRERQLRTVTQAHPRSLTPVQLRKLMLLAGAVAIAAGCRHREFTPIEAAFPFLDTRLIRFLMSVPENQLFRPGESRSLQRRALKTLLPEVVRRREGKRGPDEALCRALRDQWPFVSELMKDSYAANLPGIDPKALRRSIELARCGAFHWIGALPSILCLEVWIRSRAAAQSPAGRSERFATLST